MDQLDVPARVWMGRAEGERATAETFRLVAAGLEALAAERELIALAHRAVDDELRHAERCWRLACRYAGYELPSPQLRPLNLPTYDGSSDELRQTLHVVAQCCMNETTASAFLERCLADARDPEVRATLRDFLSDEVDHARIGWAHLASRRLSIETRQGIAAWLPQMIQTNLRMWGRRPPLAIGPQHAEHGVPTWDTVDAVVATALDELIVPGLRHVGSIFDGDDAVTRGAPSSSNCEAAHLAELDVRVRRTTS